jgi:regulatory protein
MAFGARTNTQRPGSRVGGAGGGALDGGGGAPSDPVEVARSIGLNLLSMAPKSRAQLTDAMRARGVPDDAANQVLDRFTEVGLIDDVAFAGAWVSSRQSVRGLAPRALATELRRQGIAEPTIAGALAEVSDDDVEASARALIARRLSSTAGLPAETRIRRLTGFLNRKGYPGQLAFRVVREALEAEGTEVADLDDDMLSQES